MITAPKLPSYYSSSEYRQYYLARQREKIRCELCQLAVSRSNYNTHLKSKKHRRIAPKRSIGTKEKPKITDKIDRRRKPPKVILPKFVKIRMDGNVKLKFE